MLGTGIGHCDNIISNPFSFCTRSDELNNSFQINTRMNFRSFDS
jgi:hypothetical protein